MSQNNCFVSILIISIYFHQFISVFASYNLKQVSSTLKESAMRSIKSDSISSDYASKESSCGSFVDFPDCSNKFHSRFSESKSNPSPLNIATTQSYSDNEISSVLRPKKSKTSESLSFSSSTGKYSPIARSALLNCKRDDNNTPVSLYDIDMEDKHVLTPTPSRLNRRPDPSPCFYDYNPSAFSLISEEELAKLMNSKGVSTIKRNI